MNLVRLSTWYALNVKFTVANESLPDNIFVFKLLQQADFP